MRKIVITLAAWAAAAALGGCAAPTNLRNAENYAQAGYAARDKGDWPAARMFFSRALVNAELADSRQGRAQISYEYGRVLGVMCDYDEAEKNLLRSLEFGEKQGAAPMLSLLELGLLNETRGRAEPAEHYYAELIPVMEREGAEKRFPLGVADTFEHHAHVLAALGRQGEADAEEARARKIRAAHPEAQPFGRLTPYGTQCAAGGKPESAATP